MPNIKKIFLGKDDPNRISLESVFPLGDLVFSTPLEVEQGKHQKVIVEGDPLYLEHFDDCACALLESEQDPLGRWVALTDYLLEPSLELIYEPRCAEEIKSLRLLLFVLRADLIQICNLRLASTSRVVGTKGHITFLSQSVPLPDNVGNGFFDVAPPIVLPRPRVN